MEVSKMNIICPHCKNNFDLSGDMAFAIQKQVRDREFEKELASQVENEKKLVRNQMELDFVKRQESDKQRIQELEAKLDKLSGEFAAKQEREQLRYELESQKQKSESEMHLQQEVEKVKGEVVSQYKQREDALLEEMKRVSDERDYYKDLKARMSTKMIGETLEQHCENEFNKIRMSAFRNAEFHKDNEVSQQSGSKGDYIFRDFLPSYGNGVPATEFVSIMFEMKNEADETKTKHKNSDFFKELDKDRREKGCEYAVLVSMLEPDSDLYNQGIVDVSYEYDKMYVVRPQCFIPILTVIRNAAMASVEDKQELARMRLQDLDMECFRTNFETFRKGFGYNCEQSDKRLNEALDGIDKAIAKLQSVKDALTSSIKQIAQADKKVDAMTVEKLCKGAPSVLERIDAGARNADVEEL